MNRLLRIFFLCVFLSLSLNGRAQTVPINAVAALMDSSSYGTPPYVLWERYVWSYYAGMYPQWTNMLFDVGHGGQGLQGDWQNDWQKRTLPYIAVLTNSGSFDFYIMQTDNGGNNSNVYPFLLNFTNAPPSFYDGVSGVTNQEINPPLKYNYFFIGAIPADTAGGDDGNNSGRQAAVLSVNTLLGTPQFDLLHELLTNGWVADIIGDRVLGFYTGVHPKPPGHLAIAQWTLVNRNVETNVAQLTINWNGNSFATNHCALSGASISGNTFSATIHWDRMGMGWDRAHGNYTNDAMPAFAAMPVLTKQFNWIVQATNLPTGTYTCTMDSRFIFSATAAELAAGVNLWTNKNAWIGDQQQAVLDAICDVYGVDPVTLAQTHPAGSPGAHGLRDDINLRSDADGSYGSGNRGTNLVNALASDLSSMVTLSGYVRQAAVQTNHTITITFQTLQPTHLRIRAR